MKKSTIALEKLPSHGGDDPPSAFSYLNEKVWLERENIQQLPCHMTHTNEKIRQIILDNMHQNRHVTEEVTGPRYCPSIESKILRFGSRNHHFGAENADFWPFSLDFPGVFLGISTAKSIWIAGSTLRVNLPICS